MEKIELCCLPTPCHRLDRMSSELGCELWIKRDDLTGLVLGGNKGRKLEFLMAEALAMGATCVVTCGSSQSNFVRQLGAACAMLNLHAVAAVMDLPYAVVHGEPPFRPQHSGGNVVLNQMLGVEVHRFADDDWEVLAHHAEDLAQRLEESGERVYRIPIGGSSPVGAYGFVRAAGELTESFDCIVTASSSGSTQAGLMYALHGTPTKVIGIASDPEPEIVDDIFLILSGLEEAHGRKGILPSDIDLRLEWAGPAYGIPSEQGDAAIMRMARTEGILLDPIYSGKAFAGVLSLAESGELAGKKVLFWHTGGTPAFFAYPPTITWD